MKQTDNNLVEVARVWAEQNPDFINNFISMLGEYRTLAEFAGIDVEEDLPFTKACLLQISELFDSFEVSNG
ncbi:hypothetical protein PHB09_106 [Pseudomonas phage PHB09]|uniref:Uncharacterized protein n=1 Tax=Pseudomonas phage PHB09 TaxID=2867265 RepID=A0AAE9BNF6_9CAUD|nr:hypothetical protein QGX10_gp105 [Pseudomonas phage PHB09]UAV84601.1 hypothetical protein PHB09_106 [Pseudomonas phage PHB09]